ncbi:MAG: hypothetical protein K0R92_3279, partial [Lachnospiraceae bacterium]|nr:hypothetical protein [Lachnospiraceae bacterium]
VWLSIGLIAIAFGIGLLILSFFTGVSWNDIPTYSMEESYEGIEGIDIQMGYGEVNIVQGNEFHVKADNMPEDGFETYVTDDRIWVIKENTEGFMNLFGLKFPISQLVWWKDDLQPEITITVPQNFTATEFNLDLAAGDAEVEAVRANRGTFSVEAGRMEIKEITITDSADYSVSTGEMIIKEMKVNNINVDCGVGSVKMEGSISGDNYVECGVGDIDMDLTGDARDYNFNVESGIGRIKINEDSYHSIDDRKITTEGAVNYLSLECGIGDITVSIQ